MKIDLNVAAQSQLLVERTAKKVTTDGQLSGQNTTGDRATLSSASASVASLAQQALQSPEVRQSTVDALRQAVSSGQYEIDPAKIASAIAENSGK